MSMTCSRCGSTLSAVTFTCVRGKHCKPRHVPGGRVELAGQMELPDTEPRPNANARRLALEPMRPDKRQKACDVGLFSDDSAQRDLF